MKKRNLLALLLGVVLALSLGATNAAASHIYVNDFEQLGDDTAARGWLFAPPVRTPSGYDSPTDYADGIQSAHGRWHARLKTTLPEPCVGCPSAFNDLGTASGAGTFRSYVTEVDVYLDVAWTETPAQKVNRRFDWSSAIADTAGNHRRDFVFNAGTDGILTDGFQPGFFINVSTNAGGSGWHQNPCPFPPGPAICNTPVHITQSDWYTLQHRFYSCNVLGTDYLAVDFTILRHNTLVKSWTICAATPTDTIATTGRDMYGWFVMNEINDLAIDCLVRRPPGFGHPSLGAPCRFDDDDDVDECPDDDEDNDGLSNQRESLLLTLLGNQDSDLDGIEDGNDDANGNGEDDEDEDDEDDDCPNDSDGDGEDDEDEDDDEDDD